MSRKVCIIQGQYLLGGRIRLGTVEQTRQCLEVAVELFHSDKKLTYWNPIGLLQRVRNIILKHLAGVKMKHGLKMKLDAFTERRPTFGRSLCMRDFEDILPRYLHHWAFITFSQGCLASSERRFPSNLKGFAAAVATASFASSTFLVASSHDIFAAAMVVGGALTFFYLVHIF